MPQSTEEIASACTSAQVGFQAYVAARRRRGSIPELAKTLALEPSSLDAVFAGARQIADEEARRVLDALKTELEGVGVPAEGPGQIPVPGKIALRQRQLIGWRLYLHLRSTGLGRRTLASAAGVAEKTVDRILAIDQNVGLETVARVVAEAGLDLAAVLAWPPRDATLSCPAPQAGLTSPSAGSTENDEGPAAAGSPADPARCEARRPRARWAGVSAVAAIALAAGYGGYGVGRSAGSRGAAITLQAPIQATTNETTVLGSLRPSSIPTTIVFYVRPENHRTFYRQATSVLIDQSRYQAVVRLGDERMDEPSLTFRVVAVAVEVGKEPALPGTFADPAVDADSEEQFLDRVAGLSLGVSEPARVVRVAATPARESVRLRTPVPGARVASPFRVEWDPESLPLYVEIRANAREVAPASGPGRTSGSALDLAPGRYELKLRRSPQEPILAVSSFEVVPGGQK